MGYQVALSPVASRDLRCDCGVGVARLWHGSRGTFESYTDYVSYAMMDDPRIKRVLKRYPKEDQFSDASMDVSGYGDVALLEACRRHDVDDLSRPIELDEYALSRMGQRMGIPLDCSRYDYFLHSYVRLQYVDEYYRDPSVTSRPAPEGGPPARIPLAKGLRWVAVRPKDGKEHFEAFESEESSDKV